MPRYMMYECNRCHEAEMVDDEDYFFTTPSGWRDAGYDLFLCEDCDRAFLREFMADTGEE